MIDKKHYVSKYHHCITHKSHHKNIFSSAAAFLFTNEQVVKLFLISHISTFICIFAFCFAVVLMKIKFVEQRYNFVSPN